MENGCFNIHVQSQLRLGEAQPTDEPTEQTMDLDLVPVSVSPGPIHPWIAPLSPQSRMLMSHCKQFSLHAWSLLVNTSQSLIKSLL